ncbi:hypothetical protein ACFL60_03250 [Candidatus Omnitrophota bacterium]
MKVLSDIVSLSLVCLMEMLDIPFVCVILIIVCKIFLVPSK